jgi:Methyltransferase domain
MATPFDEKIAAGDISLFKVESQSTENDRRSFLAVQRFIRDCFEQYTYLEVGSHLGGSLYPYLLDDRCASAVSVDPRPVILPDERGDINYVGNSTQRMIDTIVSVGGPELIRKLTVFESDVSSLRPEQVGSNVRVSFIDAVHTNDAVFRDFLSVYDLTHDDSLIAFHDSILIADACRNIEAFLKYLNIPHHAFYLPDQVFLITLGRLVEKSVAELSPIALDSDEFYSTSKLAARDLIARTLSVDLDEARVTIERLTVQRDWLDRELAAIRRTFRARIAARYRVLRDLAKSVVKKPIA